MSKMIASCLIFSLLVSGCATLPAQQTAPAEAPEQPAQGTSPGQAPEQPEAAQTELPLPPESEPQDKPSPLELPEGVLLEFRRSGGFAGLDEVWRLYADGRLAKATSVQPDAPLQEWQADPEQVTALLETIVALDFFDLPPGGKPEIVGADLFSYSLAVNYNGFSRQVSAVEGAAGAPEALWQAVTAVQIFVDAVAKGAPSPLE